MRDGRMRKGLAAGWNQFSQHPFTLLSLLYFCDGELLSLTCQVSCTVLCLKLKKFWSLLLWFRKLEHLLQPSCSWTVDCCLTVVVVGSCAVILCYSSRSALLLVCCRCLKELQASTPRRRLVNSPVTSCAPRCRRTCWVRCNHHHRLHHRLSRTAGEVCCGGGWGRGWLGLYTQTTEVFYQLLLFGFCVSAMIFISNAFIFEVPLIGSYMHECGSTSCVYITLESQ